MGRIFSAAGLGRWYGYSRALMAKKVSRGKYVAADLTADNGQVFWSEELVRSYDAANPRWGNRRREVEQMSVGK